LIAAASLFSRRRSRRRAAAARGRTRGGRVATFAGSILLITITISERARAECVRPSAHPPRDDTFLPTLRRTSLLTAKTHRKLNSSRTLIRQHAGKPPWKAPKRGNRSFAHCTRDRASAPTVRVVRLVRRASHARARARPPPPPRAKPEGPETARRRAVGSSSRTSV
jgi:hypothetical protein